MDIPWRKIKPGWYVLAFFVFYSIIVTASLTRANARARALQTTLSQEQGSGRPPLAPSSTLQNAASMGLWFPIPGAHLPQTDAYLPGAFREYRQGVSQGFVFHDQDAGIPISYGTAVIASGNGIVERADQNYISPTPDVWQALIEGVSDGDVSNEELDQLRGRQLWLRTADGRLLRYAHLSRLAVSAGDQVYQGQVVAYVGNSGTDEGVAGNQQGARLHFEVWEQNQFFGANMNVEEIRRQASILFVGP